MRTVQRNIFSLLTKSRFSKVDAKVENKIGFIYMDSQKDLNALSLEMRTSLCRTLRDYENNSDVKVTVILSNVKKAFCAGANIKEFQNRQSKDFEGNDIFKQLHDTFDSAKKPIIAGVNGVALGGGCQIALLCDVVFCSEQARFGLPELKLGLIPGIGGTQRLARIAGRVNAMRYIFTSEFIKAQRAYEMGLVSEVFKTEELHSKVIELATEMTQRPLSALIAAKLVIKESQNIGMREGIALERTTFYPLFDTKGTKEGVSAFVEKRKPNHLDL